MVRFGATGLRRAWVSNPTLGSAASTPILSRARRPSPGLRPPSPARFRGRLRRLAAGSRTSPNARPGFLGSRATRATPYVDNLSAGRRDGRQHQAKVPSCSRPGIVYRPAGVRASSSRSTIRRSVTRTDAAVVSAGTSSRSISARWISPGDHAGTGRSSMSMRTNGRLFEGGAAGAAREPLATGVRGAACSTLVAPRGSSRASAYANQARARLLRSSPC